MSSGRNERVLGILRHGNFHGVCLSIGSENQIRGIGTKSCVLVETPINDEGKGVKVTWYDPVKDKTYERPLSPNDWRYVCVETRMFDVGVG